MPLTTLLYVWPSSHGCGHQHLPTAHKSYLSSQRRFEQRMFDAKGGRQIEHSLVEKVADNIIQKSPRS